MKALFLGDVSPIKDNAHLFNEKNIKSLFGDTLSLFEGNDINMINLECALTDSEKQIAKIGPALKAPKETAGTLKAIGITVCGLSNNHFFDFGKKGANDTVAALEAEGLLYTGYGENKYEAAKPLVIEKDGEKVCIIAVCEHEYSYALDDRCGCNGFDPFETPLVIRVAKEQNDRVVVLYHGGKELCQYPSPRLRSACRAMAKSGADLIICQHSHCIGCYEEFNNCHILYGQGNFHFVKESGEECPEIWNSELAVRYDTKSHKIEFVPTCENGIGITLAKGNEHDELLSAFNSRNEQLKDGSWYKCWVDFCEENKQRYILSVTRVVESALPYDWERFAHYLDCEAHLDVWKEIFKTDNYRNEKE